MEEENNYSAYFLKWHFHSNAAPSSERQSPPEIRCPDSFSRKFPGTHFCLAVLSPLAWGKTLQRQTMQSDITTRFMVNVGRLYPVYDISQTSFPRQYNYTTQKYNIRPSPPVREEKGLWYCRLNPWQERGYLCWAFKSVR